MQQAQVLSRREEFVAREFTKILRNEFRRTGAVHWFDIDDLLVRHRRLKAYSRAEALAAIRHGAYREDLRFHLWYSADTTRSDGFKYVISLREHLLRNHHGV